MEAVGYDLYCKMLNEAVKSMKGQKQVIDFVTTIDLDVDAFIPESYIVNEYQKLDIYKRIAAIESRDEAEDMRGELMDRFGQIPKSVENLLRVSLIRMYAHDLYITEIRGKKEGITLPDGSGRKDPCGKYRSGACQLWRKADLCGKGNTDLLLPPVTDRCGAEG